MLDACVNTHGNGDHALAQKFFKVVAKDVVVGFERIYLESCRGRRAFANFVDVGVVGTKRDAVVLGVVESIDLLSPVTSNVRIQITIYKFLFR